VLALLANKIVSAEPELLCGSQYFNQIVELLCKVLLFVYEKELVENTLNFFNHLIFSTAKNPLSEGSKNKVISLYNLILKAMMSIAVREREVKAKAMLAGSVMKMLNISEQISGLSQNL
jgi:hypothetical protein